MSSELDRKMIHCILATGNCTTFQQAGVTIDWLEDIGAKSAYHIILEQAQLSGSVPGLEYLIERGANVTGAWDPRESPEQLASAMRISRHKALNARLIQELVAKNTSDPEAAVDAFMKGITAPEYAALLTRGRNTTLRQLAPEIFKSYISSMAEGGVTGVETPYPSLTKVTKGWQRGELYTLYAPVKSLKSFNMLNFGMKAWRVDPRNVLFVTTEMPAEQLTARLACMMYEWDFNAWRDRSIPKSIVAKLHTVDLEERWHWFQPSGTGAKAIAEVKAAIAALNMRGGVSLVLWDGHYRSTDSEEWNDVYSLVRGTRVMALDKDILQPPVIVTAQEGSQKGKATHKVYSMESSLMLYTTKTSPDKLLFQTTAVREGPSLEMEVDVSFRTTSLKEASATIDGDSGGHKDDAVKQGWV